MTVDAFLESESYPGSLMMNKSIPARKFKDMRDIEDFLDFVKLVHGDANIELMRKICMADMASPICIKCGVEMKEGEGGWWICPNCGQAV